MAIICVDFDHTLWDTYNKVPLEGARDAISALREAGHIILIHSCNNVAYIKHCLDNADIRYDVVWDRMGKPVADCYLDDKGMRFTSWAQAVKDLEGLR